MKEAGGDFEKFRDIARLYRKQSKLRKIDVRDAVQNYLTWREETHRAPRTVSSERYRLNKLIARFQFAKFSEITDIEIRDFCENLPREDGKKGKLNGFDVFKTVKHFFAWAKKKGYLVVDPAAGMKPSEFGARGANKDYYKLEQFGRMLRVAAGLEGARAGVEPTNKYRATLLPYFVLGGFAGLRTREMVRYRSYNESIRWSDLANGYVHVRDSVGKQTKRKSGNARNIISTAL
jgi:hypothetical protein